MDTNAASRPLPSRPGKSRLKARARKFVGATNEAWLRPPGDPSQLWPEIGKVLRPPKRELWHFGGEIYIPEQAEFDPVFRQSIWAMAKDRAANWKPSREDMAELRLLAEDDFARSLRRFPVKDLRRMVRRSSPNISSSMLDRVVQNMKE